MSRESVIKSLVYSLFEILKDKPRYVQEGSSLTNFEAIFDSLNDALMVPQTKSSKPLNADVESFYRNTMSFEDFYGLMCDKVIQKASSKIDTNLDPLLTISWSEYSSLPAHCEICGRIPRLISRQLWGIFHKLDSESVGLVNIEDLTDVVLKMMFLVGREETAENIHEWFCNQRDIDFWSLFSALVENHLELLQAHVVHTLYEEVFHEIMKQGRMTKKGHKVASWRDRWFVLTSSSLIYYESLENRVQKGMITLTRESRVEKMPPSKGKNYLFRITDGVNGTPYDIAAPDPQMLEDWLEVLQVVIAVQTEEGRNLLHRLRLTRQKLFPQRVKGLPQYQQPVGRSIYNEGNFRVVLPTASKNNKSLPTSPQTSSSSLAPTVAAGSTGPSPSTSPDKESFLSANVISTGPATNPSPVPRQLPSNQYPTSPLTESPRQTQPRPTSPLPEPPRQTQPRPTSPLPESPRQTQPQPTPVERPIPTPRKKGPPISPYKRNSLQGNESLLDHVSVDGKNYAVIDKISLDKVTTKQSIEKSPKAHQPLKSTQSSDAVLDKTNIDYATLDFSDEDTNSGDEGTKGANKTSPEATNIRRDIAKTRFDYSEVIVNNTTKDVDAALKLKMNRPPPEIPSKYEGGMLGGAREAPVAPPRSMQSLTNGVSSQSPRKTPSESDVIDHPTQQQMYRKKTSMPSPHYVNVGFEAPPPPVPKRQESAGRSALDMSPVPPPITPRYKS